MLMLPVVVLLSVAGDHVPRGPRAALEQMLGQVHALQAQLETLKADIKTMKAESARARERSRQVERELMEDLLRRGINPDVVFTPEIRELMRRRDARQPKN